MVAKQRAIEDYNRDVTQAWHVARLNAWAKTKKGLPALSKQLASGRKGPQIQSVQDQRRTLEMMSLQYGIPLRPAKAKEQR